MSKIWKEFQLVTPEDHWCELATYVLDLCPSWLDFWELTFDWLQVMINASLWKRIVPLALKNITIHLKRLSLDQTVFDNFFPVFSLFLEKLFFKRSPKEADSLDSFRSGFRPGSSTEKV